MSDPTGAPRAEQVTCVWSEYEDGPWDTACGQSWVFEDGGPSTNGMRFCPFCGASLIEMPYVDTWDDNDEYDEGAES